MEARNGTNETVATSGSKLLSESIWIEPDGSLTGVLSIMALLVTSTFIICGNVMVIAAMVKRPRLLVGTPSTTFFLINLAVADLMVGIFKPLHLLVFTFLGSEDLYSNYWACYLGLGLEGIFVGASTQFISLTTFDRYLYIHRPFWHLRIFTLGKAYFLSGFFWMLIAAFGLLPAAGWNAWDADVGCRTMDIFARAYLLLTFGADGVILIAIMLMNLLIYRTARSKRKHINTRPRFTGWAADEKQPRRQSPQGGRAGRVIAMVIVAYIVCSAPHICTNLSFALIQSEESMRRATDMLPWILILRVSNSGVNPLIYYIMIPAMRDAMRRLVHCNTFTV